MVQTFFSGGGGGGECCVACRTSLSLTMSGGIYDWIRTG